MSEAEEPSGLGDAELARLHQAEVSLLKELSAQGCEIQVKTFGASMYPLIRAGDVLQVRAVAPSSLRRGDIIVVQAGPDLLRAHRLVSKQSDQALHYWLFTRGDASRLPDPPIDEQALLGKVVAIGRPNGRRVNLESLPWHWLGLTTVLFPRLLYLFAIWLGRGRRIIIHIWAGLKGWR